MVLALELLALYNTCMRMSAIFVDKWIPVEIKRAHSTRFAFFLCDYYHDILSMYFSRKNGHLSTSWVIKHITPWIVDCFFLCISQPTLSTQRLWGYHTQIIRCRKQYRHNNEYSLSRDNFISNTSNMGQQLWLISAT